MGTPYLIISLFLFSALLSNAAQTPPAVLDTDGNTVQGGVKYVIVPVQPSQGGGLDLASTATGNQTCPKSVVQVAPKAAGNSVTFFPVNPKDAVRNGTDLNVQFSGSNAGCPESTLWQIAHDPENTDVTQYVLSGGDKGNPSFSTARSWFMILKTKNGYKFKFCPVSLCDCNPVCQDIGIKVENGHRRLVVDLRLTPLEVNFKKA
ncbi:PREDICTED: kunitz trypsin inhibitor 2-like [Ipomoea nil]|uniref:kunitz trypsin inhibitor 2-like n=1 Tax=Ipomoea nil TaxID=35883 RepID=UPI000901B3DD|nr:PREDICTED: kunitz trypsin inhibitor 2-like [Ipomoea nil]